MRERSKSGRFLCFGGGAVSDEEHETEVGKSPAGSPERADGNGGAAQEGGLRRRSRLRSLRNIFRSAAFVSSLNRSGKKQREREKTNRSNMKSAPESRGKSAEGDDDRRPESLFTSSASSSSSSSSTSSSASSSCFSSSLLPETEAEAQTKPKTEQRLKATLSKSDSRKPSPAASNYGSTSGVVLLLISLSVMVFCGRLCAIMWASSWLYLIARRNSEARSPDYDVTPAATRRRGLEAVEKKRVVLEGLLERNRKV